MFGMCDVWDVGCWGCGMLGMWDVRDVRCSGCGMFGMWNVGDVGCGMFAGMWDVDLQNAHGHHLFSREFHCCDFHVLVLCTMYYPFTSTM